MRPTDEDQPGSRRPNLMSTSRRSAGDVNILAMLDGLGSRSRARRPLLWYGIGGVLACGLIVTLVWLARARDDRPDASMATAAPPAIAIEHSPARAAPEPPTQGATIVNLADTVAPAAPSPAVADPAPVSPPPAPAASRALPVPHATAPTSLAAHVPPARAAVAGLRPGVAHPGPKRGAPAIKPLPAATVDTDVALISAIIQHAATRRDAVEDAGCRDQPCGPRMPQRPDPPQKPR